MEPINNVRLVDQVVQRLKDHIQNGDNQEGEKMPSETSLSDSLGVGRGTIREALRILSIQGYVALIPRRGAFIASKNPTLSKWFQVNELELMNVLEVRFAIEPLAVSLAIENCSKEDVEGLHANIEEAKELIQERNSQKLAENDEKFHAMIALLSKNSLIPSINKEVENYLHEFRLRTFQIEQNRYNLYPAHKAIVEGFDMRDVEKGVKNMQKHLDLVYQDLINSISEK